MPRRADPRQLVLPFPPSQPELPFPGTSELSGVCQPSPPRACGSCLPRNGTSGAPCCCWTLDGRPSSSAPEWRAWNPVRCFRQISPTRSGDCSGVACPSGEVQLDAPMRWPRRLDFAASKICSIQGSSSAVPSIQESRSLHPTGYEFSSQPKSCSPVTPSAQAWTGPLQPACRTRRAWRFCEVSNASLEESEICLVSLSAPDIGNPERPRTPDGWGTKRPVPAAGACCRERQTPLISEAPVSSCARVPAGVPANGRRSSEQVPLGACPARFETALAEQARVSSSASTAQKSEALATVLGDSPPIASP